MYFLQLLVAAMVLDFVQVAETFWKSASIHFTQTLKVLTKHNVQPDLYNAKYIQAITQLNYDKMMP